MLSIRESTGNVSRSSSSACFVTVNPCGGYGPKYASCCAVAKCCHRLTRLVPTKCFDSLQAPDAATQQKVREYRPSCPVHVVIVSHFETGISGTSGHAFISVSALSCAALSALFWSTARRDSKT